MVEKSYKSILVDGASFKIDFEGDFDVKLSRNKTYRRLLEVYGHPPFESPTTFQSKVQDIYFKIKPSKLGIMVCSFFQNIAKKKNSKMKARTHPEIAAIA